MEYRILLNTIDKLREFSTVVCVSPLDMDIRQGRFVVDAKSILAIFSFDLTQPLTFIIHLAIDKDEKELNRILEGIDKYIVK